MTPLRPVERTFSQYVQVFGSGEVNWSFREHIRRNQHHRSRQMCRYYPFSEFGCYSEQLERYLERFGPNVWVGFYEDFKERPCEVLRSIFRFLGVGIEFLPDAPLGNGAPAPACSCNSVAQALGNLEVRGEGDCRVCGRCFAGH